MNESRPKPSLMGVPTDIRLWIADILKAEDPPSVFNLAAVNHKLFSETNKFRFHDIQLTMVSREILASDLDRWTEILQQNDAFSSVQQLTIHGSLPSVQCENHMKSTMEPCSSEQGRASSDKLINRQEFKEEHFNGKPHWKPYPEYTDWLALSEFLDSLLGLRHLVWHPLTLFPSPPLDVLDKKYDQKDLTACKLHILSYNLPRFVQKPAQRRGTDWYEYQLSTSSCLSSIVISLKQQYKARSLSCPERTMFYEFATKSAPNLTKVNITDVSSELPRRLNTVSPLIRPQSTKRTPLQGLSLYGRDPWSWNTQADFNDLRVLELLQANETTLQMAASREYPALSSLTLQPCCNIDEQLIRQLFCSLPPLESLHLCGQYSEETFQAILDLHGESIRKLCLVPVTLYDEFDYHRITPEFLKLIRTHCPNLRELRVPTIRSAGRKEECDLYRALGEFPKLNNLTLKLQQCDQIPDMDPGEFKNFVERDRRREMVIREWFINIAVDERLVREIFFFIAGTSSTLRRLRIGFDTSLRSVHPEYNYEGDREITKFMSRQYVAFRCDGDRLIVREIGAQGRKLRELEDPCSLGFRIGQRRLIGFSAVFPLRHEVIKCKAEMSEGEIERALANLKRKLESEPRGFRKGTESYRISMEKKNQIISEFKRLHPGLYEWGRDRDAAEARRQKAERREEHLRRESFNKWARENPKDHQEFRRAQRETKRKKKAEEMRLAREAEKEAKRKAEAHARDMANPNRDWGDDSLDRQDTRYIPGDPEVSESDWWNKWYSYPLTDLLPEKLYG
ncbi:uncharacterized protein N7511_000341 [Penicillium nucicola]|uniref:uncharacterized protein n=1 Tax=Penicillium nucicola TaxID=1850975 RepID=UPI00254576AD|nr:uncharacterized protein N7511_000341 [Penicillium nucicola]KAJ5775330.1 hypothetical protein N7511_000341 [Penicillium nucicola]